MRKRESEPVWGSRTLVRPLEFCAHQLPVRYRLALRRCVTEVGRGAHWALSPLRGYPGDTRMTRPVHREPLTASSGKQLWARTTECSRRATSQ